MILSMSGSNFEPDKVLSCKSPSHQMRLRLLSPEPTFGCAMAHPEAEWARQPCHGSTCGRYCERCANPAMAQIRSQYLTNCGLARSPTVSTASTNLSARLLRFLEVRRTDKWSDVRAAGRHPGPHDLFGICDLHTDHKPDS